RGLGGGGPHPASPPAAHADASLPGLYSPRRRGQQARRRIFFRSAERNRRGPDHETIALTAFEPHIDLDGARNVVLLRDRAAHPDRSARKYEPAERRAEATQRTGARPALDECGNKPHAHVARRDHARKALAARTLVIREAREVDARRARIGPHLVLRERPLDRRQLVTFRDVVVARHRAPRYMKRLSTLATSSPR